MPADVLVTSAANASTVDLVAPADYAKWLRRQPKARREWLTATGFDGKAGDHALLSPGGGDPMAVMVVPDNVSPWPWSSLAATVPPGRYALADPLARRPLHRAGMADAAALGWALAGYRFSRYRADDAKPRRLTWPAGADRALVTRTVAASELVRDLINTPAGDLGPAELAAAVRKVGTAHKARVTTVVGAQLLARNYPTIHAVGRAAAAAPRLVDLRWGHAKHPKVTLVGKGVTFDSGGLDLKTSTGMRLMKKDMGGAAHALGLASMVMAAKLPVRLRVLIGAVENAVSGDAYRPGDVIKTRHGLTVEVGNTDAEGRLVLCDCLAEAARERPDTLLDFATLTGAARVALGTELPALFANDDALASDILDAAGRAADPLWRLPLFDGYRQLLKSDIADLVNVSSGGYAGAITAALFLQAFVPDDVAWAHFDLMAWNTSSRPGRPEGGEAMGLRAVYAMLARRYGKPKRAGRGDTAKRRR